jgi:hypothetical protein
MKSFFAIFEALQRDVGFTHWQRRMRRDLNEQMMTIRSSTTLKHVG